MPDRFEIARNREQHRAAHARRIHVEALAIGALYALAVIRGAIALTDLLS